MTATVDTLTDLVVAALEAVDFEGDWGFAGLVEIEAMSLPTFELVEATDTVQIKVAAYPNVDTTKLDRSTIAEDHKLGIGIVAKLEMTDGQPDETHFRSLKSLAEQIRKWIWTGTTGYGKKVVTVSFPAWYDFEKAKSGVFLTTINATYRMGDDA